MIVRTTIQGLVAAGVIAGAGLAWAEIKTPTVAPMVVAQGAPGNPTESAPRIMADAGYASAPPTAAPLAKPLGVPLAAPVTTTVPDAPRDTGYAAGRDTGYAAGRDHDDRRAGHDEHRHGDHDDGGRSRGHGLWSALPGSGYVTASNDEKHTGDRHDD